MIFDEIVIGSGLAALGVVLGLPAGRRVLVIGGPAGGRFVFLDRTRTKVCAYLGHGGLGTYWHGVISTGGHKFPGTSAVDFERVLRRFYPNTDISERFGKPWLFVPWRPVRPKTEWLKLESERRDRLVCLHDIVSRFTPGEHDVSVQTATSTYRGRRVWVCAGALHTPGLLESSLNLCVSRPFVSDHVFCYLGQIERWQKHVAPLRVQRTRHGVWFEGRYDGNGGALYTLRPARFEYSRLDYGIEQRSLFGPPTGRAFARIMRGTSMGQVAEALYNRSGLFPNARVQSVYAQIDVPDAHRFHSHNARIDARPEVVQTYVDDARTESPWGAMRASRRPEIFIPSTHLHGSVDGDALRRTGVNEATSRVQVVDASILRDIGPDHHSFKLMVLGFQRAQALTSSSGAGN